MIKWLIMLFRKRVTVKAVTLELLVDIIMETAEERGWSHIKVRFTKQVNGLWVGSFVGYDKG